MIARQIVIAIWFATFAPAETPKNIVDKLNSEMVKALNLPDVQAKLATIGAEPI
jgi:tripartite-type tricarboxylate transporter receptor subunit TctC